ncbi:MAG: hypothetical protein A2556_00810 [Candidatus Vogelbacteria bacterium RIFOXYD2_FULL_44_9]|uniref:Uncharacterized protein n=1 Tax=Candidatus Vogelbacteria bacterium RIFOXYD2_FULL_44_9 TaxID=1802441 RepID=A0A1G2QNZ7_9BACT|nr:MAG: hypothetical protein A2556_00810 [Candidatus Vogelbacteria bacterium RIFOXYD2_FULL_44_9]
MDMQINKNKTGLTFACLFGWMHLVWGVVVALGLGQVFLNFIFGLHMLNVPIIVMPFDLVKAVTLVIVTFVVGYFFGWFMAFFWNKCFKDKK